MLLIFFPPLSSREIYSQLARWERDSSRRFLVRRDENFRQSREIFFHQCKIECIRISRKSREIKGSDSSVQTRSSKFCSVPPLRSSLRLVASKSQCVFSTDENKASSMIIVRIRFLSQFAIIQFSSAYSPRLKCVTLLCDTLSCFTDIHLAWIIRRVRLDAPAIKYSSERLVNYALSPSNTAFAYQRKRRCHERRLLTNEAR